METGSTPDPSSSGSHLVSTKLTHNTRADEEKVPSTLIDPTSDRRARSPPRNEHNQIYCDHVDCSGKNRTFKRESDWKKHMDRHNRPYKCREDGCELNPGFTYNGGLTRHNREVHKINLSTEMLFFCPFENCKRSSGTGFARKENLEAHKKRCRSKEMSDHAAEYNRGYSQTPAPPLPQGSYDYNEQHHQQATQHSRHKRRRMSAGTDEEHTSRHYRLLPTTSNTISVFPSTLVATMPLDDQLRRTWANHVAVPRLVNLIQQLQAENRRKDKIIARQNEEIDRNRAFLENVPVQTLYRISPGDK